KSRTPTASGKTRLSYVTCRDFQQQASITIVVGRWPMAVQPGHRPATISHRRFVGLPFRLAIVMISGETWNTALDALRANKFKAFLTMLGVVIGSACLVLVVTVGLTGKQYILAQIEGIGANLIYGYHVGAGPASARP